MKTLTGYSKFLCFNIVHRPVNTHAIAETYGLTILLHPLTHLSGQSIDVTTATPKHNHRYMPNKSISTLIKRPTE
jgi:hypothetical protein